MNKKKNVDILHIVKFCTYFMTLTDICWIDDKKSHLKHVLRPWKMQKFSCWTLCDIIPKYPNTGGDQDRIESAGAATVSTSTVATRTEAMNGTEVATATTTAMRPKRDCRKPDNTDIPWVTYWMEPYGLRRYARKWCTEIIDYLARQDACTFTNWLEEGLLVVERTRRVLATSTRSIWWICRTCKRLIQWRL